jgi:hypothetical protein
MILEVALELDLGDLMKRLLLTTALVALIPLTGAIAGTPTPTPTSTPGHFTFLLGVGVEFGDGQPDVGVTGKLLALPVPNVAVGGGATYFPGSGQFGLDLSAGLHLSNFAALGGYDFVTHKPQISGGFTPDLSSLSCPSPYTLVGNQCQNLNPSDRRRKRDVVHVATLSDGMKLYSFRYLDSDTVYVGVMAQDLLEDPRWRHAVITGEDGFYVVDYDQLDLVMITLDQWNEHGLDAMVLGSRPAALQSELAA